VRLSALLLGIAVVCLLPGAASASAGHAPGVHPKPRFATSGGAAYCTVQAESQDDLAAELFCWRPRDGWAAWIGWRAKRGRKAFFTRPPRVVHGLTVLKGYRPRSRVLQLGRSRAIRCETPADFSTCGGREGVVAFRCSNRPDRLVCSNAARHGFSIGRVRGYGFF
jgi:hypothetical protein